MKIGFIFPNIPGHLNPMTALARQLQILFNSLPKMVETTGIEALIN
jgi:UDP:flavonoid glycosyltransferase YjiC (YdhE family)